MVAMDVIEVVMFYRERWIDRKQMVWWQKARWKVAFRSGFVLWLLSVPLVGHTFDCFLTKNRGDVIYSESSRLKVGKLQGSNLRRRATSVSKCVLRELSLGFILPYSFFDRYVKHIFKA